MTENKRFIVKEDSFTDKVTKKTYCELSDIIDLCNRLWKQTQRFEKHNNRLIEENEQLKQSEASTLREFAKGTKKIQKLAGKNLKLKQENEQLKEHQRTLESKIGRLKDRVKTFEKHYSRKDIERYKKMEKCNCITSDRLRRYS